MTGFEQMKEIIKETITAYNAQRSHASLDFLTPLQVHEQTGTLKKRWKNYKKKQIPNATIEMVTQFQD